MSLIEEYNRILSKAKAIDEKISRAAQEIDNIKRDQATGIPARISNLEVQLKKIDDYLLKIEAFRKLAEKNLESQNVLTIEAPPGYRVNLNRLRQWSMMIDPMSSNDPYAQRVYVVAQCDKCFLEKKQQEFTQRIEELRQDIDHNMTVELRRLEEEIDQHTEEFRSLAMSEEMSAFALKVKAVNQYHWFETAPRSYHSPNVSKPVLALGAYALPFDFPRDQRPMLRTLFGKFYDADSSRVLLPIELDTDKEFAVSVQCTPSRIKHLDRALQNLMLNIIEGYPAGKNKIYILDGVRFNSASLGSMKQLEASFAIAPIPRNPNQLTTALEHIVSNFADLDDLLELCDSVTDYNAEAAPDKQIARTTILLFGWSNSFDGKDKEYLQRIMTNYERYGISFVSVAYSNTIKKSAEDCHLPEYAAQNAVQIKLLPKETTIQIPGEYTQHFAWYTMMENLPAAYVDDLRSVKVGSDDIGNAYPVRYNCTAVPEYTRTYKKIELPFGIDSKDKAHSVSFENENFAAYLVGASRSGKSTLLHTLIAGLIRSYHPDNVELWLADFKQLEFKKYIDHCPPHVKYVLLDESTELVYDLIDKLTEKMIERQRIFARLGKERIDQIDPMTLEWPMPVIFVILDEFSIMSQAIAEEQTYRLRLQNLLAKGAALGIKFLFSSQTFTTGVAGLTATARAQIQQRIAMKGTKEEITETLELSANLRTEQVRNWMDALPPHYALVKYHVSADALPQVMRVLVMYFPDYAVRDELIDKINGAMTAVNDYQPSNIRTFVDKHPVLVDGNTYEAFSQNQFLDEISGESAQGSLIGDETFLSLGTPRLMSRMKLLPLTPETRENILLIGRSMEQQCVASVVTSAMRSFIAQKKKVRVWAYGKDRLYQMCKSGAWQESPFSDISYSEGIDRVCDEIRRIKAKLRAKTAQDELIVLIGMDRICSDFDFVDGEESIAEAKIFDQSYAEYNKKRETTAVQSGAVISTKQQAARQQYGQLWVTELRKLKRAAKVEGKTPEQIERIIAEAKEKFFRKNENPYAQSVSNEEPHSEAYKEETTPSPNAFKAEEKIGAYCAQDDFMYIVKQGSRMGYHFMLVLNDLAYLKATYLKLEWFRHRMSFQVPIDDSRELFRTKIANGLPEHICQYSDSLISYSFRPYLHPHISWDGWFVNDEGDAINPFAQTEN